MATTLLEKLRRHDWFYGYADDHRAWKRGAQRHRELQAELARLNCPFGLGEVRMAAQNMILEDFAEESPGQWYRQPRKYKNVAPTARDGLIERARAEEIVAWARDPLSYVHEDDETVLVEEQ